MGGGLGWGMVVVGGGAHWQAVISGAFGKLKRKINNNNNNNGDWNYKENIYFVNGDFFFFSFNCFVHLIILTEQLASRSLAAN